MNRIITIISCLAIMVVSTMMLPCIGHATILGLTGTTFNLTAKADTISTGDGDSMWMWGYAQGDTRMQYPGPTLIVNQGDTVTVTLRNRLPVPVSIVFPGQTLISSSGGSQGLLAREVPASDGVTRTGPVTYRFIASNPGTYTYYSGTRPDLQVEMGLVGTIIVRPTGFAAMNPKQAYGAPSTAYDQEYLFFLTEADPLIHQQVAFATGTLAQIQAQLALIDTTKRRAVDWFINGRNFPDTMGDAGVGYLPTQPYNCMPMTHPGDKVLMRIVGAGRDFHPFHTHGQNHLVIARDGRLLSSNLTAADLAVSDFTTTSVPGETVDAIWGPWTGAKLGWDIYGTADINPHTCTAGADGFDPSTREYCADHYQPIPVELPPQSVLDIGVVGAAMWSGSPYLGMMGELPPAITGQNPMGGYSYMWHSHSERELTTNNIFPGGMATMALVVPVGTPIP
jgi:manganese oxidase